MNNLAFLSNLAGADGFLIMFFVLIFFGAKKLPELARSMGLAIREFNKAKEEFTTQLTSLPAERPLSDPPRAALPSVTASALAEESTKKVEETTVAANH